MLISEMVVSARLLSLSSKGPAVGSISNSFAPQREPALSDLAAELDTSIRQLLSE